MRHNIPFNSKRYKYFYLVQHVEDFILCVRMLCVAYGGGTE